MHYTLLHLERPKVTPFSTESNEREEANINHYTSRKNKASYLQIALIVESKTITSSRCIPTQR